MRIKKAAATGIALSLMIFAITAASAEFQNSAAVGASKVFDLDGFTSVDVVEVNSNAVSDYEFKDGRLLINSGAFENAGDYTIEVSGGGQNTEFNLTLVSSSEIIPQDSGWTLPSDTVLTAHTAAEYGDYGYNKSFNFSGEPGYLASQLNYTFSELPEGIYDVEYYVPYNSNFAGSVNYIINDVDLTVTDTNAEHTIKSLKKNIAGERGYEAIGTFEFDTSSSICVSLNEENILGTYPDTSNHRLVPGKLRLTPSKNDEEVKYYFENGTSMTDAINAAQTGSELEEVVRESTIVDTDIIKNMTLVYDALTGGTYNSVYDFANAVKTEAQKYITVKKYTSDYIITKYGDESTKNYMATAPSFVLWNGQSEKNIVFSGINTDGIKDVKLCLNMTKYSHNTQVSAYTLTKFEPVSGFAGDFTGMNDWNSAINRGVHAWRNTMQPVENGSLINGCPETLGDEIISALAASEDGNLGIKLIVQDAINGRHNGGNSTLFTAATLEVSYDISDITMLEGYSCVTNDGTYLENHEKISPKMIQLTFNFGKELANSSILNYFKLIKSGTEEAEISVTKSDDNKSVTITPKNGFEDGCTYEVVCDKYIKFNNDDGRYQFEFEFETEYYPIEYSGLSLTCDGEAVAAPINGKIVEAKASVKNNTAEDTAVMLMVNLFENTELGVKMISSKFEKENLKAGDTELVFSDNFEIPEEGEYFITVNIWDSFTGMNTVEMSNTASYEIKK